MTNYKCKICGKVTPSQGKPKGCDGTGSLDANNKPRKACKNPGFDIVPDKPKETGFKAGDAWNDLQTTGATVDDIHISEDIPALKASAGDTLPDAEQLEAMVASARGLRVPYLTGQQGMAINVSNYDPIAQNPVKQIFKDNDVRKIGVQCYENSILPLSDAPQAGIMLIHQTLAPCRSCRTGYKAWAKRLSSTIVVAFDQAHDGLAANHTAIFSPIGGVFGLER